MRKFAFITVGTILAELNQDGLPITRATFYRLEKRLGLPQAKKTSGQLQWRVYTRQEADVIKERIKKEFNVI